MADAMKATIDSGLAQWNPPPHLVDHVGQSLPPDMVFFTPPPTEIGDIISAYSSMDIGKKMLQRRRGYKRIATLVIMTTAFMVFGLLAIANFIGASMLAGMATLIVGPFIAMKTGYIVHRCSFVGTQGFTSSEWNRRSQSCKPPKTFLFNRAATSYSSIINMYYGPIYHSSMYMLGWKDENGKVEWYANTQYRKRKGLPPIYSLYHFYQSAENAWKRYEASQGRA
jgi:hypothetical protein